MMANNDAVEWQRAYYRDTARHYNATHVADDDEHAFALTQFSAFARSVGAVHILDIGAGTGRAISTLARLMPEAKVIGIEPVAELRAIGHADGIPPDRLIAGDALSLPFADGTFDFVIETGVLHHIADPDAAVAEMIRVARQGVMLSDSNKFGQGSRTLRMVKAAIGWAGLWQAMIWLTTRGRMAKYSESDGVYYSYSVFDSLALIRKRFPRIHLFNTVPLSGESLKHGASHICLIATRPD